MASIRRPNVVLLYTDQQRWDTLRCGGNPHILTPNLDALAAGGAVFTRAYCNNPVCMPSRQSLLSGQYPSALGTTTNGIEMPESVLTLHKVLKLYGYHTANIGKLHFKNHATRDHREAHPDYGFDELVLSDEPGCYEDAYIRWVREQAPAEVENCRCTSPPAVTHNRIEKQPRGTEEPYVFEGPEDLTHTAFVAAETARYIRAHAGRPFFVIAGFYAPHAPVNPPRRFVDLYDPASLPAPLMNPGENRLALTDERWKEIKAYYYALVSHIDDQVAVILDALDETGVRENTLVLFTSDHGDHLGDHGCVAKGPPGYDSCARVPLIVSCPGRMPPGQTRGELVEGVDIAPTVLDFCGIQVPPIMQGRSFRPLLDGGSYWERDSAFIEFREPFGISWKAIAAAKYKYCVSNEGRELLFDLTRDPGELRNVAREAAYETTLHDARRELIRRWFDVEKQYPLKTGPY